MKIPRGDIDGVGEVKCEYLMPSLTNTTFDEHSQVVTEDGVDQIPVEPISDCCVFL